MFNTSNVPANIKAAISDETFRIFAKAGKGETGDAELLIMEEIGKDFLGEGIGAKDVVAFLNDNRGRDVNVRINSPGGLVYDGLQIYNGLANHDGSVQVTIEGLAFSAASLVAMAGDQIRMHQASDIGIHRAWGVAMGNSATMASVGDWLTTIDEHLIDIYTERTGQSRKQIEQWMDGTDDGTLFNAEKAVQYGFADEIIPLKSSGKQDAAAAKKAVASRRVQAEHQARLARIRQRAMRTA